MLAEMRRDAMMNVMKFDKIPGEIEHVTLSCAKGLRANVSGSMAIGDPSLRSG